MSPQAFNQALGMMKQVEAKLKERADENNKTKGK